MSTLNKVLEDASEITITPDGNQTEPNGLNYDYITEYSYGSF